MKKVYTIITILMMATSGIWGQQRVEQQGLQQRLLHEQQDTTILDSLIVKPQLRNYPQMMENIGEHITIGDSLAIAMEKHVEKNRGRKSSIFRVRIYFDNSQNARITSSEVVDTFKVYYPEIPIYRTYVNPYFKVSVGNFRTKSDAMRFMESIKPKYPTAFLVKESSSTI